MIFFLLLFFQTFQDPFLFLGFFFFSRSQRVEFSYVVGVSVV